MPALVKFVSRAALSGAKVDRENGIIRNVSLCSEGEAKGHNKLCDRTTLEQLRECAKEYDDGLRIRFNPNTFAHTEGELIGYVPNDSMRIKGGKLVGDLHTYKNAPSLEYLYELAERTPGLFGLSVEFSGMPEEKDGQTFARCDEILAAQVVDLPAANPTGLFSEGEISVKNNKGTTMTDADITKLISENNKSLVESFKELFKPLTDALAAKKGDDDNDADLDDEQMCQNAGIGADDDKPTKMAKMKAYKAKLSRPIKTFGDVMQAVEEGNMTFFSKSGARKAASGSGDGEGAKGDKGGNFESLIEEEIEVASKGKNGTLSRARAIFRASKKNPKLYNEWMKARLEKQVQLAVGGSTGK